MNFLANTGWVNGNKVDADDLNRIEGAISDLSRRHKTVNLTYPNGVEGYIDFELLGNLAIIRGEAYISEGFTGTKIFQIDDYDVRIAEHNIEYTCISTKDNVKSLLFGSCGVMSNAFHVDVPDTTPRQIYFYLIMHINTGDDIWIP